MVKMVSSSAGEGPGSLISRGFTERRIFRSSMASGIGIPWSHVETDHPIYRVIGRGWQATRSSRPPNSLNRLRPFHVRWSRFINQRGQRFICRHPLLSIAAEAPDRHRMGFGFLLADNEKRRDFRQRMFADLVVDLLVAQVEFY